MSIPSSAFTGPADIVRSFEQTELDKERLALQKSQFNTQMDWQRLLRGEGGSPTGIALYTGPYEQSAFQRGAALEEVTRPDYGVTYKLGTDLMASRTKPLQDWYDQIVKGQRGAARLAEYEPVAQATRGWAQSQAQALREAMQSRLNQVNAQDIAAGYGTTGSASRNRMLANEFAGRSQVAQAQSAAEMQIARDLQAMREANWQEYAQTAPLGVQLAEQQIAAQYAPGQAALQDFATRYGLATTPARINQQYTTIPGYTPLGSTSPSPLSTGLAGLGSIGQSLLQQYYNKSLQNELNQYYSQQQNLMNEMNYGGSYDQNAYGGYWGDLGAASAPLGDYYDYYGGAVGADAVSGAYNSGGLWG